MSWSLKPTSCIFCLWFAKIWFLALVNLVSYCTTVWLTSYRRGVVYWTFNLLLRQVVLISYTRPNGFDCELRTCLIVILLLESIKTKQNQTKRPSRVFFRTESIFLAADAVARNQPHDELRLKKKCNTQLNSWVAEELNEVFFDQLFLPRSWFILLPRFQRKRTVPAKGKWFRFVCQVFFGWTFSGLKGAPEVSG